MSSTCPLHVPFKNAVTQSSSIQCIGSHPLKYRCPSMCLYTAPLLLLGTFERRRCPFGAGASFWMKARSTGITAGAKMTSSGCSSAAVVIKSSWKMTFRRALTVSSLSSTCCCHGGTSIGIVADGAAQSMNTHSDASAIHTTGFSIVYTYWLSRLRHPSRLYSPLIVPREILLV